MNIEDIINIIEELADMATWPQIISKPEYAAALFKALDSLRAQQEREKGCEFCKDNFYRRSLYKFCPYCGYEIDHEPKEAEKG